MADENVQAPATETDKELAGLPTPEEAARLAAQGMISPEVTRQLNQIYARRQGSALREEQAKESQEENLAAVKTDAGTQQAQQGADPMEAALLKGTQINPQFASVREPVGTDTVLAPSPFQNIPSTLQAPVESPKPEDVAQAVDSASKQQAQATAQQAVAVEAAKREKEEHDKALEADQQVEKKVAEDSGSRTDWGGLISHAVAVMLGAASQAYTKSEKNPGIEAFEKAIEREAAARKYNQDQKEKLFKQALELADLELKKRQATVSNQKTLAEISNLRAQNFKIMSEMQLANDAKLAQSKRVWTQEEVDAIPDTVDGDRIKGKLLRMPDGTYQRALSKEAAEDLRKNVLPGLDNAVHSANTLKALTQHFGNNPIKKLLDRSKVGESEAAKQALIGAIRLEYFGPGAFTDTEQAIASKMLGDPTNILSIASANQARLDTILSKLKFARRLRLQEAGIVLPESKNEKALKYMRSINPGRKDADLINELISKNAWNPNED